MTHLQPSLRHVSCLDPKGLHRMAYWEWGDPESPRVVMCVHGLSRQGRDFDVLASALVAEGFRVICPDVVGRGHSDGLRDPAGYVVPTYVADMVTLIARLDVQELAWVGTSMGGLIGMALASLPGSPINKLVLNDIGPVIEATALQRISAYLGDPTHWPSIEAAAEALWEVSKTFGPHTAEQWLELCRHQLKPVETGGYQLHYDPAIAFPLRHMTLEAAQLGTAVLWYAYDQISCPTLLLHGVESDLLSSATVTEMSQRGPRALAMEVEGVGHAPTLVQADQVQGVVRFLTLADVLTA